MNPFLSVIMPVYNQEKYLKEAIESVLDQEFKNFEFLILDDGSTDSSARIIRDCAKRDNRIVPFFEQNTGKCEAIGYLVNKANTNLLAFLDADDVMLPQRLKRQVEFHRENPDVDASSCHCLYIDENGRNLGKQRYTFLKSIEDCKKVVPENKIVLCAFTGLMTSKNSFIETGGLRQQFWPSEDEEFVNRLIEKGFLLVIIQEELMKYRVHSSSITNSNVWHSFVETHGYVHHCIHLRREGKPEITYDKFMEMRELESFWIKWNRRRTYLAKVFHREAGFSFFTGKYLSFIWKFGVAAFLNPKYVFATLQKRIRLDSLQA